MNTLAEPILERDKERGRRRSRSTTPRTSDAVAAQNRPAQAYIDRGGKPAFCPSAALLLLGVALKTTPSSSRLAYGTKFGLPMYPLFVDGSVNIPLPYYIPSSDKIKTPSLNLYLK